MATLGDLRDTYTIETRVDDQASAQAAVIGQKLDQMTRSADAATASTRNLSQQFTQAGQAQEQSADKLSEWSSSSNEAQRSADSLAASQGELLKKEVELYGALAGGKAAFGSIAAAVAQYGGVAGAAGAGTSALGTAMGALLTPVGLAVTAMTALGIVTVEVVSRAVELNTQQRELSVAIQATGRSAAISADQLQTYIGRLTQAGVAAKDAATIANNLGRAQGISGVQAGQITALTPNLATALGTGDVEAAKKLTEAAQGSAEAIKDLDKELNFLTPDQAANITKMLEHNERAKALAVTFDALGARVDGLRQENLGPLKGTIDGLKGGWDSFIDSLAKTRVVQGEIQALTDLMNGLAGSMQTASLNEQNFQQNQKNMALAQKSADLEKSLADAKGNGQGWFAGQMKELGLGGALGYDADAIQRKLDDTNTKLAAGLARSVELRKQQEELAKPPPQMQGPPVPAVLNPDYQKGLYTSAQATASGTKEGQITKLTEENAKYNEQLQLMGTRTADNATRFDAFTAAIAENKKTIVDLNKVTEERLSSLDRQKQTLDAQIKEQIDLNAAYAGGYDQVAKVIAQANAEKLVAHDGIKNLKDRADAVDDLKDKEIRLASAKSKTDATKDIRDAKFEADAQERIGAAYDGTTRSIVHQTDVERARAELQRQGWTPSMAEYGDKVAALAGEYDRAAKASEEFAQRQSSVQAVTGLLTNVFNEVGDSIAAAFAKGSLKALDFGALMHQVMQTVIRELAQLAIINPIINSILGSNALPTLGSAASVIGGGGGSSGNSLLSTGISGLSTASSISGVFGGPTIGSSLGLTGTGGLLTAAPGGIFYAGMTAETAAAASAPLAAGVSGPVAAGAVAGEGAGALGGAGSAIGGAAAFAAPIAAGIGLGALAGHFTAGGRQSGESNALYGATLGASVGTIFGPVGSLVGGLIGGIAGSLFGPANATPYSSTPVTIDPTYGTLTQGRTLHQLDPNAMANADAMQQQILAINTLLLGHGIKGSEPGVIQVGSGGARGGELKYQTLNDAFSNFRFTAADPILNNLLQGKPFGSPTAFATFVQGFDNAQAAVKAFLGDVDSLMKGLGVTTGSVADSVKALNSAYDTDIASAKAITDTNMLSAAQMVDMAKAEQDLLVVRDKNIAAIRAAATAQVQAIDDAMKSRQLNAEAQMSGSPQDAAAARLFEFDIGATAQRAQLKAGLVALYGDVYLTTTDYTAQMAILEATLGKERLAIVTQGNAAIVAADQQAHAQAQQSATAFVTSLRQFVTGLTLGADSPLSPLMKLQSAQATFTATANRAIGGGDAAALGSIQGDASNLLGAAKAYYGSSTGYAAIFAQVSQALKGVAGLSPDTLTASFLAQTTQTQTTTLAKELQLLRNAVGGLQTATVAASAAQAQTIVYALGGTEIAAANQAQLVGAHADQLTLQMAVGNLSATLAAWGKAITDQLIAVNGSLTYYGTAIAAAINSHVDVTTQTTAITSVIEKWGALLYSKNTSPRIYVNAGGSGGGGFGGGGGSESGDGGGDGGGGDGGGGFAAGGWVGNGKWNRDTVRARFAGGGNVMLAGGEFIVSAPAAARYASVLPSMNAGSFASNDNGSAILSELRALRVQSGSSTVAETRSQTASLTEAIAILRAEVRALRDDVRRAGSRPDRLAS